MGFWSDAFGAVVSYGTRAIKKIVSVYQRVKKAVDSATSYIASQFRNMSGDVAPESNITFEDTQEELEFGSFDDNDDGNRLEQYMDKLRKRREERVNVRAFKKVVLDIYDLAQHIFKKEEHEIVDFEAYGRLRASINFTGNLMKKLKKVKKMADINESEKEMVDMIGNFLNAEFMSNEELVQFDNKIIELTGHNVLYAASNYLIELWLAERIEIMTMQSKSIRKQVDRKENIHLLEKEHERETNTAESKELLQKLKEELVELEEEEKKLNERLQTLDEMAGILEGLKESFCNNNADKVLVKEAKVVGDILLKKKKEIVLTEKEEERIRRFSRMRLSHAISLVEEQGELGISLN